MPEELKPSSQRQSRRRREIEVPLLRQMTEQESRVGKAAVTRLVAALLADEKFMKTEQERQRKPGD